MATATRARPEAGKGPKARKPAATKSGGKKSIARVAQRRDPTAGLPTDPAAEHRTASPDVEARAADGGGDGAKVPKVPKQKLVRDSFTMPRHDFALIGTLKERMLALGRPTRKSELLRAGLHALMTLPDDTIAAAIAKLPAVKRGRPKIRADHAGG